MPARLRGNSTSPPFPSRPTSSAWCWNARWINVTQGSPRNASLPPSLFSPPRLTIGILWRVKTTMAAYTANWNICLTTITRPGRVNTTRERVIFSRQHPIPLPPPSLPRHANCIVTIRATADRSIGRSIRQEIFSTLLWKHKCTYKQCVWVR